MNDSDLDWGAATPEAYDVESKEAIHVLNVRFVGDENRSRAIRFVCARVLYFHKHLPIGSFQRIRFDLRGQLVSNKYLDLARNAIVEAAVKHGIQISVEFITN